MAASHGWSYFGLTTTLNVAVYCASVSSVSAAQQANEQVADVPVTLYGSDDQSDDRSGLSVANRLRV
jgi:hypothetical protein